MRDKLSLVEFGLELKNRLLDELGAGYEVRLDKVLKNNSLELLGLTIRNADCNMAPNIYLNSYFESYKGGTEFDDILLEILEAYHDSNNRVFNMDTNFELDKIKDNIIFRLVNCEYNKELFKTVPHVKFLDLAVTFHCLVGFGEEGISTFRISTEHFKKLGITLDELNRIAEVNTKRLFPPTIRNMSEVMFEMLKKELCDEAILDEVLETLVAGAERHDMFILSNNNGINGATALLYTDVLKDFANKQGADIYILPSSIHELILVPAEGKAISVNELRKMVVEVNDQEVPMEDVLSNNVYLYKRNTDRVEIR